jgi:hypothetical protein
VLNVATELFSGLFCGYELVQIRHDSHRSQKGREGKSTPSRGTIIRIYSAP